MLAEAWHALREELLEQALNAPGWPRRPWGWWMFERDIDSTRWAISPPWTQAKELHRLDELTFAERSRLPGLIPTEATKLASRAGMEPQSKLAELRDFAGELGVELEDTHDKKAASLVEKVRPSRSHARQPPRRLG